MYLVSEGLWERVANLLHDVEDGYPCGSTANAVLSEMMAEKSTQPKSPFRCPHCGSFREPWFSRTEPMGNYCGNPMCGKNIDEVLDA